MDSPIRTSRLARTIVSYAPSRSLIRLREFGDLASRLRGEPHEADFLALSGYGVADAEIVDVGANRGQSIRSFRLFLPTARIHAFEPNARLSAHLEASARAEAVHNVALSDRTSTMQLLVPRYGHTEYDTRATLDRGQAEGFLSADHFARFRSDRAHIVEYTVEVRPLDSFGLAPDIVKIDAEGAAAMVIRGGYDTIRSYAPLVIVEDASGEPTEAMTALGYRPARFDPDDRSLHLDAFGVPNTFFVKDRHRELLTCPVVGA